MMPLATLDQLDQVPWANLDHAYGSAEDIPDMIRALGSGDPDARAQARGGLHASLDHQGVQRFESTLMRTPGRRNGPAGVVHASTTSHVPRIAWVVSARRITNGLWLPGERVVRLAMNSVRRSQ